MTPTEDNRSRPTPHRPPAGPTQWATVTQLGVLPGEQGSGSPAPMAAVDGSLALKEPAASREVRGVPQTPELHLVGRPEGGRDEVQVWAARFAQAVVEVLGGDRPLAQLLRWTTHRVYVDLERRLNLLKRTSDAGRRRRTIRPQVRSVHVFHPTPESAEVSVHVRHGQRSRAIAARLELIQGRWQCTALQLG